VSEFEDKLNSILGNQAAMNQIMALARSLSGDQPSAQVTSAPDNPENTEEEATYVPVTEASDEAPDLSALLGQIDPKMIQTGMDIIRQAKGAEDQSTALLNAMRPFLKEERRARLDRAIQLARMTRLIRATLSVLGEEGKRV